MCVRVCCVGLMCGLWCPSMRGGDVVGAHGEGGCRRSIPDMGGVRWSPFDVCRIGERVVIGFGYGCLIDLCGDAGGTIGDGVDEPGWLSESFAGFCARNQKSSP